MGLHRLRRTWLVLSLAVLLPVACTGVATSPPPPAASGIASPTSTTPSSAPTASTPPDTPPPSLSPTAQPTATQAATASPTALPTASPAPGARFTNPVIDSDFPDPHLIAAEGAYYAYATTDGVANIRVARSLDLVEWEILGEALPELARWSGLTPLFAAQPHRATWAPAVAQTSAGFVMYYTAPALDRARPDGRPSQCIGTAVSERPEGPFVDNSARPIVCQPRRGGSIDATHFMNVDGTQYLIWKNDGNCCAISTRFYIQRLTDDGLDVVGEPTDMGVRNDVAWEKDTIEAPTLMRHGDRYYLFYSGNEFWTENYAVGYAVSSDVFGAYVDAPHNPILVSGYPAAGTGHQSIVTDDDGDLWMTYHAWDYGAIGFVAGARRAMWIDPLTFDGDRPVVHGPNADPQPVP